METQYILYGVVALIVIYAITSYNRLIALENNRENSFADIDVQLKQRYDLIPQLLESVKGYMKHEEGVLTKVTEARTRAMGAKTVDAKIAAEAGVASALSGLNIAVEAYPDLKASSSFMNLQTEISDIENKLAAARRFFNSATKEFNNVIEMFPSNIVAKVFGFKEEPMFEIGAQREELEKAPNISFS